MPPVPVDMLRAADDVVTGLRHRHREHHREPAVPQSVQPTDGQLLAAPTWGALVDRRAPTTHCFIHLVSVDGPHLGPQGGPRAGAAGAHLATRHRAAGVWDVLRVVIVECLSAGLPAYFDWLIGRDESTHELIGAMRRHPARDQVLLCFYDDDGRASRHDIGRFRAADLRGAGARRLPRRTPVLQPGTVITVPFRWPAG